MRDAAPDWVKIRALFWGATVGCLAVACSSNLTTSTGDHDGAAGASAAGGASGTGAVGGSGSASDASGRIYCIPGASADDCSGATFACPHEPTCAGDAACPTLTMAGDLCSTVAFVETIWETICGPYLVVTDWTVDNGSATFYDRTTGAIVAILQGGNAGTSCLSGPPQFTVPACSTLPYCAQAGCRSQLLCPDGGAPDAD
jgi:hypothetical protein